MLPFEVSAQPQGIGEELDLQAKSPFFILTECPGLEPRVCFFEKDILTIEEAGFLVNVFNNVFKKDRILGCRQGLLY